MSSNESHRELRTDRPRGLRRRLAVERLEARQLMAYSAFGYSLPDLEVSGYAAKAASWGGPLVVDVNVQNTGASSLIEPTHLEPGAFSTADSPPTTVQVFASTGPNGSGRVIALNSVAIPVIRQNSNYETISTIKLPNRPAGFPDNGGRIFLTFVVNNDGAFTEASLANNVYRVPAPVRITAALPNLQVVGFDIPGSLQPGDVISPTIRIANFGAGDPGVQGGVTVQLVASVDRNFGPGDAVIASYTIPSLPGISDVPTLGSIATDLNVIPAPNENTRTLAPVKLPTTPGTYFLGIVIDPYARLKQAYAPNPALRDAVTVGPADRFLPSGDLLVKTNGAVPIFPAAPSTIIGVAVTPIVTPPIISPTPIITPPIVNFRAHAKALNAGHHKAPAKGKH